MQTFLLTALTMAAFAANSLLNRAALADDSIDPILFGVIRLVSGAVMLSALLLLRGRAWQGFGRKTMWGALSLFVYIFGFSGAYVFLDAGLGALILFGTVQITMFGAALLGQEDVPPQRMIGAVIAALGLVLLLWPGANATEVSLPFAGLMIAAGIGWGVYSLIGRGAADPLGDTALNFAGAALLSLLLLPVLPGMSETSVSTYGVALACVSGAVTSALGYALWYRILPVLGASRAAISQLTVPVIAILAGTLLLAEPISWALVTAAALVIAGVTLGLVGKRG